MVENLIPRKDILRMLIKALTGILLRGESSEFYSAFNELASTRAEFGIALSPSNSTVAFAPKGNSFLRPF
jgi:hypothetical protein